MNRAIAHRPAFESRANARMFLAQLARAVRSGDLEVHAYCVLNTHYHLLVRSPKGNLSSAMQRLQNDYVKWFNASRRRDGPLFRGRFQSRTVTSDEYQRLLVRYIDENPCAAGLSRTTDGYVYGSAYDYVHRDGPRWLERSWVEAVVAERTCKAFTSAGYLWVFGGELGREALDGIQRVIESSADPQPAMNELLGASPRHVLDWLGERARVADGGRVGLPLCNPSALARAIDAARAEEGHRDLIWDERALLAMRSALMFELCEFSIAEIAAAMNAPRTSVSDATRSHRWRVVHEEAYARCTGRVASAALSEGRKPGLSDLEVQSRVDEIERGMGRLDS